MTDYLGGPVSSVTLSASQLVIQLTNINFRVASRYLALFPVPLFPCALSLDPCSLATANTPISTSISTHQCHHKHTIPMSTCKLSAFIARFLNSK